jgi:hypothetical protein
MDFEYVLGYALIQSGKDSRGNSAHGESGAARPIRPTRTLSPVRRACKEVSFREARADFDAALD